MSTGGPINVCLTCKINTYSMLYYIILDQKLCTSLYYYCCCTDHGNSKPVLIWARTLTDGALLFAISEPENNKWSAALVNLIIMWPSSVSYILYQDVSLPVGYHYLNYNRIYLLITRKRLFLFE